MRLFQRSGPKPLRAFDLACRVPWAITEDALQTILEIAARENPDVEAVAAKLGRPLDHTHTVTVRDGVATIPVEGPLFRHANLFTQISGATSIETLATDLNSALADPTVKGVILYVDSPGGEVNGTSEFAQMIYDARGQKPVVAYISDMGCSAAYWIASAADEVVVADTATVGSIGVIAAMRDPSGDSKSSRSIEFVSSQSPNKRPDPTTEKGRAQIQTMVDDLAGVFVEAVARNRGVSTETVMSDFGQGGVFVGQKAITAGLADRIGSYESVHAELASPAGSLRYRAEAGDETISADSVTDTQPAAAEEEPITSESTTSPEAQTAVEFTAAQQDKESVAMTESTTTADESIDLAAELQALRAELANEREAREQAQAAAAALAVENRQRELATIAADWHGPTADHVAFMEGLTPEALAFYTQTMTALHEQVKAGSLFEAAGVTGSGNELSPKEELEARAKALASEKNISYTEALGQVAAQDPPLYAAYRRGAQVLADDN